MVAGKAFLMTSSYDEVRFVFSIWHPSGQRTIDLDRAYALEGVFGEISFIIGPALAVILSVEIAPPLGLIVSLIMTVVATAGMIRLPEIELGILVADRFLRIGEDAGGFVEFDDCA